MKASDIKEGVTYMFTATVDPIRKHLEGLPFLVSSIRTHRSIKHPRRGPRIRFINDRGEYARAEELEPLNDANPF